MAGMAVDTGFELLRPPFWPRRWPTALRGAAQLLLVLLSGCAAPLLPSPPSSDPFVQGPVPIPPSTLDIAVAVGLGRITEEAERSLPLREDAAPYTFPMDGGADRSGGVDLGYHVERSPLSLRIENGALLSTLLLGYWIKAEYRPLGPLSPRVRLSCGTDGEPLRKASATFTTRVDVDPQWATVVKTTVSVRPETRCLVSVIQKDLTAKVIGELEGKLRVLAGELDAKISAAIHLRERIQRIWELLQEPLFIDDGVWLSVSPEGLSISPLTLEKDVLSFHVRLIARPALTGSPKSTTERRPLPDLIKTPPEVTGSHVLVPVEMSYEEARGFLTRALKIDEGKLRFPARGSPFITVRRIDLSSFGPGALVRIEFDGSAEGCAYLVATPSYDPKTRLLAFTHVDFSLETKNLVLRSLEWLDHEALRSSVEQALRIDLSTPLARLQESLTRLLNRKGEVFQLSGELQEFRLSAFHADPLRGTFKTTLLATGSLEAIVP